MEYCTDLDFQIRRLFFTKISSHKVLKLNYEVLLIDSIYKTNVYRMPLYIITGVTPLNTTYYVGFAFLSMETVEDYEWVLQCIKNLYLILDIPDPNVIITDADRSIIWAISHKFPFGAHLLYLWHLNKNVLSHCKKLFEDEESWTEFYETWNKVLYAHKEEEFHERWEAMQIRYADHNGWNMDYLEFDIINSYCQKVVKCYISQVQHFGNTSNRSIREAK